MNIDERLQAMAMNLELSIRDHKDTKKRLAELSAKTDNRMNRVLTAVESLVRAAEAHHHRPSTLENGSGA
jgi:hypothetical protein